MGRCSLVVALRVSGVGLATVLAPVSSVRPGPATGPGSVGASDWSRWLLLSLPRFGGSKASVWTRAGPWSSPRIWHARQQDTGRAGVSQDDIDATPRVTMCGEPVCPALPHQGRFYKAENLTPGLPRVLA
jgi:hypothetical protein